jgi:ubiquinone/menaquinone biosynthesis C-methylase UbiE
MDETPRAAIFGEVAEVYERTRPGYPVDAVRWLTGDTPTRVLELGAGTGKLTATLLAEHHRVTPTDPSWRMLQRLRKQFKGRGVIQSRAEQIPVHAGAVDVVIAGQAFHWFDHERALPEIARVLRPGGTLALVWNLRDESVPWVRRLGKLIGSERPGDDPDKDAVEILERSGLFEAIETRTFRHWQEVGRDSLIGLVESRSYVAEMAERERAALLRQVGELYDEYGRGHDGMQLPYLTECYRAHVASTFGTGGTTGGLDDGLLIDFS